MAKTQAGYPLDWLVAEKVMGWTHRDGAHGWGWYVRATNGRWRPYAEWPTTEDEAPFTPTVTMESAWRVVERMREHGWSFGIDDLGYRTNKAGKVVPGGQWRARFDTGDCKAWSVYEADTPTEAICRAALLCSGRIAK